MRKRLVGVARERGSSCSRHAGTAATPSPIAGVGRGVDPPVCGSRHRAPASAARQRSTSRTTTYKPDDGADGGTLIIGDWQEANQFNPFYLSQQSPRPTSPSATWATLVVVHPATTSTPRTSRRTIPTVDNGGVKAPATAATR
mgnify:CR=1 FL=1